MTCDFCNNSISERILYETKNFIVFCSLGAFVPGYVLIIPRKHITAYCDLNTTMVNEFKTLLEMVRNIIEKQYGPTIVFEHGESGGSVPHAHIHILPIQDLEKHISKEAELIKLNSIDEIFKVTLPYLLYGNSKREYFFINNNSLEIPSQYLRRIACISVNRTDWNWKDSHNQNNINNTIKTLSKEFKKLGGISIE